MLKFGKKKGNKAPKADDEETPPAADAAKDAKGAKDAEGTEGEGEGEDGDAPKKKKLPLLFIIIPVALLVLGGGGGAAFFLMKPKPAEAAADEHGAAPKGGHEKAAKKKEGGGHGAPAGGEDNPALGTISEGPDGVTFYTLPDMVVNIQAPDGRPTFLKLKLTLEMADADLASHLQSESPRMQDMFQSFLRELRPEDLAGSAGTFQLRAELLRRVNLVAAPGKVDAVLIEEMLVQ